MDDSVPSCMKKYDEFVQLFCSWMSDLVMSDIFVHEEGEYGSSYSIGAWLLISFKLILERHREHELV